MMDPLLPVAVVAGVVIVALGTGGWLWFARRPCRIDSPEDAADAADALPGFRTTGAVVGSDGMAALAVDGAGRVVVVARRGKRLRACEIDWRRVQATPAGMTIDTHDRRIGRVTVAGVNNLDVRRLAPVLTGH